MATKRDLVDWVEEAVRRHGGRATLLEVARYIWQVREHDLRESGALFYTWQYDMRWAATKLRHSGILRSAHESPSGVWELTTGS